MADRAGNRHVRRMEPQVKLTIPQWDQLLSYCRMMQIEGHYFGSKAQWDVRHARIKEVLESEFAKAIAKEQSNERRKASQAQR